MFFRSEQKTLLEAQCLQRAGNKPATERACNVGKKCPQWHIGEWKSVKFNRIQMFEDSFNLIYKILMFFFSV